MFNCTVCQEGLKLNVLNQTLYIETDAISALCEHVKLLCCLYT